MTRNTRQLELLIAQSDRAKQRMIFWVIISCVGMFSSVLVWLNDTTNALVFGLTVSALVGGFFIAVIEAFNYAKYNGILWEFFEDDQPPPRDMPSGRPQFESESRAPDSRLVSRDPEYPRRIIIAGQNIRIRNWRRLARTLAHYNYHFTRDVIAEAQAFTSLSKNWPKIHAEFIRLGWVVGNEMTPEGVAIMKADYPPTFMSELSDAPAHR